MTQKQSKKMILEEWEKWKDDPNRATYQEKQDFYFWLEDHRPKLLQFQVKSGVDRWQYVHAWLNERIKVS